MEMGGNGKDNPKALTDEQKKFLRTLPNNKKMGMTRITPRHQAIARAVIRGAKPSDICEAFGMSKSGLSRLQKQELFQIELRRLQANFEHAAVDIETRLLSLGHRALDIIEESIGDPHNPEVDGFAAGSSPEEQRKDAWEILKMLRAKADAAGGGPKFEFNFNQVIADNRGKSADDLTDSITERIRAAKQVNK